MRKRAGMHLTADLMRDYSLDEETSSGLTLTDNWSFVSFVGKKVSGRTTIFLRLEYVGSDKTSTSAGNIADEDVGTLPLGWRPSETYTGVFDKSGTAKGSVTILSDGSITLKTLSATAVLTSGNNVTMFLGWISQND